jgi:hypothetical protein
MSCDGQRPRDAGRHCSTAGRGARCGAAEGDARADALRADPLSGGDHRRLEQPNRHLMSDKPMDPQRPMMTSPFRDRESAERAYNAIEARGYKSNEIGLAGWPPGPMRGISVR